MKLDVIPSQEFQFKLDVILESRVSVQPGRYTRVKSFSSNWMSYPSQECQFKLNVISESRVSVQTERYTRITSSSSNWTLYQSHEFQFKLDVIPEVLHRQAGNSSPGTSHDALLTRNSLINISMRLSTAPSDDHMQQPTAKRADGNKYC